MLSSVYPISSGSEEKKAELPCSSLSLYCADSSLLYFSFVLTVTSILFNFSMSEPAEKTKGISAQTSALSFDFSELSEKTISPSGICPEQL